MSAPRPLSVYQVKIVLRDVSPLVWRRVLLRSDTTLARLHPIVQTVMGWEDAHPHRFRVHGKEYGHACGGRPPLAGSADAVTLADCRLRPRERFAYVYDFGAWWHHDIRLEQVLPLNPASAYPACIGGKHACPPEGCGGP